MDGAQKHTVIFLLAQKKDTKLFGSPMAVGRSHPMGVWADTDHGLQLLGSVLPVQPSSSYTWSPREGRRHEGNPKMWFLTPKPLSGSKCTSVPARYFTDI